MAPTKILVTGGAGYIGGSVIAELLAPKIGSPLRPADIVAVVRKENHAARMAKLGIEVVNTPLDDGPEIQKLIFDKDIHVVVHCASAADSSLARPLIEALGKKKKTTGKDVYFIHTSGTSVYSDQSGWTHGRVRDTDNVYEMEKSITTPYPGRDTNVAVSEMIKLHDITGAIVVPPFIYGEGTGECGRQTVVTPLLIQSAINLKSVKRFDDTKTQPAVNILDLADFYVRLIQRILSGNAPAESISGYWFTTAHDVTMWEFTEHLAKAMYSRGLVTEPSPSIWASDEAAAESLGLPVQFVPLIYRSNFQIESIRPQELGWKPKWNNEKFLGSLGDDVDAFIRLAADKPSSLADLISLLKTKPSQSKE